jgi:hypothetical protein
MRTSLPASCRLSGNFKENVTIFKSAWIVCLILLSILSSTGYGQCPPVITATPSNATVCEGNHVYMMASPDTSIKYTWFRNGVAFDSTSGHVIYVLQPGNYCVKTFSCQQLSNVISVVVNPLPMVTNSPLSSSICSGGSINIILTSNVPGTSFSWTASASSPNVTGYAPGTGSMITQTLTNSGFSIEHVIYHITPSANGCTGPVTDYVVIIYPVSFITNSPLAKTICSNTSTNITLTASVPGTLFYWTASGSSPNVSGYSAGTGSVINQVLVNTGYAMEQVTYIITPIANGCTGATVNYVVTVNPTPNLSNSPASKQICSGMTTNIVLTSNVAGATFYWTATPSSGNVSGYSSGYGTVINDVLVNPGPNYETVTYHITPHANGCAGYTVDYVVTVKPSVPVSISISANPGGPICTGTMVTYTATIVNGGTSPIYQWMLNGTPVGTNSPVFTYIPAQGDVITCVLTSNSTSGCLSGNPATSNAITMTVSNSLPAGVSIMPSQNPFCPGTIVTFTATPVNGGSSPVYQWKVNGIYVGSNSPTFTYVPAQGDIITCSMTSNLPCVTGNPALSNQIVMTAGQDQPASVTVSASSNPFCPGTNVTFTATPTNGGTAPVFQWFVNGIAVTMATPNISYAYAPAEGDTVYCLMTSNQACVYNNPALSNKIIMHASAVLPVSISITCSLNPVCQGTPVTFTATGVNGGTSPVYVWKVNGVNMGVNSQTYTYTPVNNDIVTCMLYSNLPCATGNGATSNAITMTVASSLPVGVTISASANPVCQGTSMYFIATVVNGGSVPTYQWKLNGLNVGGNANIYQLFPANNDVVTCVVTSSNPCATGNPATSNAITMTVHQNAPVSISISASANPVCQGSPVNLTAIPVNGGTAPGYQWMVNGANAGTNNSTFTYNPVNGDIISCMLTSSLTCATGNPAQSNLVAMSVNPGPDVIFQPPSLAIYSGETTNILLTSSYPGTVFYWTASASSPNVTGFSSGTGNVIAQTLLNSGTTTENVYYHITPYNNGCAGPAVYYGVTVNPGTGTPVTTAGTAYATASAPVVIPVTVVHFTGIAALSLRLEYNPAIISFTGFDNPNPLLAGLIINDVQISDTLHKIIFSWSDVVPQTIPAGGQIADLLFSYLGGSATLSWNNTSNLGADCEYTGATGNPLPDIPTESFYHNGNVFPGANLAGHVMYNNASATPMDSVRVVLYRNAMPVDSTLTGTSGNYQFTGLSSGTYAFSASTQKTWSGNNSTDALKIQRYFAGLDVITEPVTLLAADVNNSGTINGTDALKVKRRFAGLDNSFAKGDWVFAKQGIAGDTIIINAASEIRNFYGLCTGDVNGSNIPEQGKSTGMGMSLEPNGVLEINRGKEFELYLTAEEDLQIGAVSLILEYYAVQFDVTGIITPYGSGVSSIKDGRISLAWSDLNAATISKGEPLVILKMKAREASVIEQELILSLGDGSELANGWGEPLNGVFLSMPLIRLTGTAGVNSNVPGFRNLVIYPDPARDRVNIRFDETATPAKYVITDYTGRKILSGKLTGPSPYSIGIEMLPPGFYLLRILNDTGEAIGKFAKE